MSEVSEVKGCCPLDCQDTCSWIARVEDGRVTSVRGARDHPITRGVLCAKVNDYEARTYATDRLLHPLRRTGPKGRGQFVRIGWDEAIDVIADKFTSIRNTFGGEALLPHRYLGSMGIVQRRALMRIFNALGSSRIHGGICGASGNALEAEGFPRGFDPEQLANNRLILLWGCNILTTSHHQWQFLTAARKRNGARIVAIDPIRTRTAALCDQHIAPMPGSDAVLAAAIGHVILKEGLADLDYAREVAADLDRYIAQVQPWSPERAALVCRIEPDTIVELAREFATASPAVIRAGVAPQQTVHGEAFVRAIAALAILCGKWREAGGGLFMETSPIIHEARAERPDLRKGEQRSLDLARLGETLNDPALSPPIKALMVWNVNPAVVQPDAGCVRQGLAREDLFTVVIDHFLTDTARFADVVLPSTTQLEHFDVVGAWGHQFISVNNPAIPPLGEAKSHGEIMRLLARRLGLDHPAFVQSDEEIAASALPDAVQLDELKDAGWIKSPAPSPAFAEKVRIADEVPIPVSHPGLLQLLTPKSHYFLNSSFVNQARQRKAQGEPSIDIHPEDAAEKGVAQGARIEVWNELGQLHAVANVTDSIRPGVLALPGKWWAAQEHGGAVANLLTPSRWSPQGQPAYNDTYVDVRRITDEPEIVAVAAAGGVAV